MLNYNYSITTDDRQTSIIWSERTVEQVLDLLEEAEKANFDISMLRVYLCYEGKPLMYMLGDKFATEVGKFDETVFG